MTAADVVIIYCTGKCETNGNNKRTVLCYPCSADLLPTTTQVNWFSNIVHCVKTKCILSQFPDCSDKIFLMMCAETQNTAGKKKFTGILIWYAKKKKKLKKILAGILNQNKINKSRDSKTNQHLNIFFFFDRRTYCTQKRGIELTFSLTFSNEEGETTEKQTRNTSVWG